MPKKIKVKKKNKRIVKSSLRKSSRKKAVKKRKRRLSREEIIKKFERAAKRRGTTLFTHSRRSRFEKSS